jgi:hypothetical protein
LSCNSVTFIAHTTKAASSSTWHYRLGHPGSKVLKQLVSDKLIYTSNKISSIMFCDAYQAGKKQTQDYFYDVF